MKLISILRLQVRLPLFLKGIFLLFLFTNLNCTTSQNTNRSPKTPVYRAPTYALPIQTLIPDYIHSVRLRSNFRGQAPVLRLGKNTDRLILEFDDLSPNPHVYSVSLRHFNRTWEESRLVPTEFQIGVLEDMIDRPVLSSDLFPQYMHFRYEFPNPRLRPIVSGNFLLEVRNFQTGQVVFSLPFFVSEQRGRLEYQVEVLNQRGEATRIQHQLFGEYEVPAMVRFPEVDLTPSITPNYWWGNETTNLIIDQPKRDVLRFHNSRNELFPANYDLRFLDLTDLNSSKILDVQPQANAPTEVRLFHDDQEFIRINRPFSTDFKLSSVPNSSYYKVEFSFSPSGYSAFKTPLFLTGDFTQWTLSPRFQLQYDSTRASYSTTILLREGTYAYKYAGIASDGTINDLIADRTFAPTTQIYTFKVYYADPEMLYDRLFLFETRTVRGN